MTARARILPLTDVFVPGGLPTITYSPREELKLEEHVKDYLQERRRILSLSGPTKSGKTVLLRSILGETSAIWLTGAQISTAQGFWELVADALGVAGEQTDTKARGQSEMKGGGSDAAVKPWGIGISAERLSERTTSTTDTGSSTRARPLARAASEALLSSGAVLVIDDFHYMSGEVQLDVVRHLKEPVFNGVPVVLAAVPHRAYDVVRVEKEMTGRVEHLKIPFWSTEELLGIAVHGFDALNVDDRDHLAGRLADEAFSSPHLMQDFCLQLCKANNVRETADPRVALYAPEWPPFFRARASNASKAAFDRLARGPRSRTDRLERVLTDGTTTDIYGVVLRAIAHTGPLTELTFEKLRAALRDVMASDPPQRHEVTRILEEMARIARDEVGGEPVVDYDTELSTLFLSDPFFAYYLRWGIDQHS